MVYFRVIVRIRVRELGLGSGLGLETFWTGTNMENNFPSRHVFCEHLTVAVPVT